MNPLELPLFLPVMLTVAVMAVVGAGPIVRATGARRAVAVALVLSAGVVAAATLTPQEGALVSGETGSGVCNLGRLGPAAPSTYLVLGEVLGNLLLFVPLGMALALVPASSARTRLLVAAIASPFVVEVVQLLLTVLDRACESGDVIDNLLGLGIGLLAGWAADRALGRRLSAPASDRAGSPRHARGGEPPS